MFFYLLFFFLVWVLIWVFTSSYDDVYVSPSASPCNYTDTFLFSECCACIFLFLPKLTSGSNHHLFYGVYVDVSATQTHLWLIVCERNPVCIHSCKILLQ